ncbi:MAG: hypothetical protein Q4F75_07805, partial [Pseudomonadota bacterium]|nr:hypothetical protein [Pseudomonadota bacterium]
KRVRETIGWIVGDWQAVVQTEPLGANEFAWDKQVQNDNRIGGWGEGTAFLMIFCRMAKADKKIPKR